MVNGATYREKKTEGKAFVRVDKIGTYFLLID